MRVSTDRLMRLIAICVIASLAVLITACGSQPDPTATAIPEPTVTPTREALPTRGNSSDAVADPEIEQTAADMVEPTVTPQPVPTAEPEATASLGISTDVVENTVHPTPQPAPQLDAIVPPCIPYPGSSVDPCERRDTWPPLDPYTDYDWELIQPAPTLEQSYLAILDQKLYSFAPQFVVRAVPIPGTTRCGTYSSFGTLFDPYDGNRDRAWDHTHCWVELAVNEYIINSGPSRLTIDIGVWIPNLDDEGLEHDARVFGERFEGWEWIITLNGPRDPNNASWHMMWTQDVQRHEDGSVVVVSWAKAAYLAHSLPEYADINLERAEMTLDEYRRQARSAYEKFHTKTGGRIFTGTDINGDPLPTLAKDATDDSLRKYISEFKVVEAIEYTSTWPPPIPGENDPNPAGLTVNDIIATRVAGGVRIPGGLEDTPTPVSALGDEPADIATAVAPHATVTAEGVATPEPVPTAVRKPN